MSKSCPSGGLCMKTQPQSWMQLLCVWGKGGLGDLCHVSARWLGLDSTAVNPLDQIALCTVL